MDEAGERYFGQGRSPLTTALNERMYLRGALDRLWNIARKCDPADTASFVNEASRRGTEHASELTRAIKNARDVLDLTDDKGNSTK